MLSRREQLQLWLQRKKKKNVRSEDNKLVEKKKIKETINEKRTFRRQSVSTMTRKALSDRTNRPVQKKERSKKNRRQSLDNIGEHICRSSSVGFMIKEENMQTLGTQTENLGKRTSKKTEKKLKRAKRKAKDLKEKIRVLRENFQMLGCERDVLILECMDKERQWSEKEKEYIETIRSMKAKEEQFQKDTNAQIVQLKQQLITGLQASVSKVNDLKAELMKERAKNMNTEDKI